jgi:ABC-type taurine transport system ATPase subunit
MKQRLGIAAALLSDPTLLLLIRSRAIRRFSVARMVDDYLAVYRQVLDGRQTPTRRAALQVVTP